MKKLDEEVIEAIKDSNGCNITINLFGSKDEDKKTLGYIESIPRQKNIDDWDREKRISVFENEQITEKVLEFLYNLIIEKNKIPEQRELVIISDVKYKLTYSMRLKHIEYFYPVNCNYLIGVSFDFEHVNSYNLNKGD